MDTMPTAMNLELVLPRDTATVPLVRHLLKHTLVEFGVSPDCVSDVEVAVTEACANVVEHATGDDEYEVRTSLTDDLCEIRVVDTGRGFDHESVNGRQRDDTNERGRGVLLMRALVDNIRKNAPNEREALGEAEGALVELKKLRDEKLLRPIQGLGYRQYPRLREEVGSLSGAVSRTITKPTDAQGRRHGELVTETGAVQQELQGIVNGRIAKLNALLKNLPHIIVRGGAIM